MGKPFMQTIHLTPPLLYTVATIWPAVCIAIVGLRLATRRAQRAGFGPDDWLVIPALIILLGQAATILAGTAQQALGHPTPPIPADANPLLAVSREQTITRKCYMTITLLSLACLTFIKLSCMFFYRRVFRTGTSKTVNIIIHVINGLILLWGIGYFFGFLFACKTNFHYFWSNVLDQLKCADFAMINRSMAITDFIFDFIIIAFPIPLVVRLQMSSTNKVAVLGIFTLGAFSVAASAIRLVIIMQGTDAQFAVGADEDYVSTAGLYFMFIECCFGLTAICLPSLSGAFKLKGVQTLIAGFSQAFSNLSRSSIRSRRSEASRHSNKHERLNSSHSATPSPSQASLQNSQYSTRIGAERDLEMYPLPKDKDITVTKQVEQHSRGI